MVMAIYFEEFLLPPLFRITYKTTKIYYPGEPVNIHKQPLINIIQDNNKVINTKKRVRVNYYY